MSISKANNSSQTSSSNQITSLNSPKEDDQPLGNLSHLPIEIVLPILKQLPYAEFVKLQWLNKPFRNLIESELNRLHTKLIKKLIPEIKNLIAEFKLTTEIKNDRYSLHKSNSFLFELVKSEAKHDIEEAKKTALKITDDLQVDAWIEIYKAQPTEENLQILQNLSSSKKIESQVKIRLAIFKLNPIEHNLNEVMEIVNSPKYNKCELPICEFFGELAKQDPERARKYLDLLFKDSDRYFTKLKAQIEIYKVTLCEKDLESVVKLLPKFHNSSFIVDAYLRVYDATKNEQHLNKAKEVSWAFKEYKDNLWIKIVQYEVKRNLKKANLSYQNIRPIYRFLARPYILEQEAKIDCEAAIAKANNIEYKPGKMQAYLAILRTLVAKSIN